MTCDTLLEPILLQLCSVHASVLGQRIQHVNCVPSSRYIVSNDDSMKSVGTMHVDLPSSACRW